MMSIELWSLLGVGQMLLLISYVMVIPSTLSSMLTLLRLISSRKSLIELCIVLVYLV